ncbi:type IV secretion system DNA-binding domain-containing protein [Alteromonas sp. 07-89-2]|nr:type IV secretion system DNA-binding domain-containing protein [Alteromonas sp. 07-89-2]
MPEIRKGKVGDFIRGADTWLHGQQMFFFSFAWLVLLGLIIATVVSCLYIWVSLDKCVLSNAITYCWAHLKGLIQPFSSITISECVPIEGNSTLPLKVITEEQFFKGSASQVIGQFGWSFLAVFILYTPLGGVFAFKAAKRGKDIKVDKYIRGAKLVSAEELKKEVIDKHGPSGITIGDLPLPVGFSKKHTLISGTTGAGKSTALTHLLKAIRARGDRAVIYDKKGEFVEMFYRDGVDHILNPSDSRSHQWTPWEEMVSPFDADWIAETLIPENKSNGGDPFFRDSPRHVFSAALQKLYLDGFRSLSTLLQATAWSDLELLTELVAGTPAETHFSKGNEKTLASIRSTLVNGVLPLRLLKESDSRGFFSIRDWIAQGDEQGADDSWLFLPVRESDIEIQKPLISTWIQSVAKGLMARGVNNDRTLWLIVDELPSLKRIPALSMLMAEGRGFGAAVVLGIQEINQLEEEFGKNTSRTILGLCSTQLHFRLNNADTAEWVSKVLGEAEREEIDEDLNYSADDIRDGVRVSSKRQNRKIVLPSEIMDLPDLSCYAKIWGVEAKARIDVPFIRFPKIAEGFVLGDENETVGMRLLNAARASRADAAEAVELESPKGIQNQPSANEPHEIKSVSEAQSALDTAGMEVDHVFSDLLGDKKS